MPLTVALEVEPCAGGYVATIRADNRYVLGKSQPHAHPYSAIQEAIQEFYNETVAHPGRPTSLPPELAAQLNRPILVPKSLL